MYLIKLFTLTTLLSLNISFAHDCDETKPDPVEDWRCSSEVTNRNGTTDFSRCRNGSQSIACYEEVKETCTESNTGRVSTKAYTSYTGVCVSSFADCW